MQRNHSKCLLAKIEDAKNPPPSENKSVVEAASAVVASMTQKLRSAENELTVVKSLLQKERASTTLLFSADFLHLQFLRQL